MNRKILSALALTTIISMGSATAATLPGLNTTTGVDTSRNCVHNSFKYQTSTNIAVGPHCFATPDYSTIPRVAAVDKSKTKAQLKAVQSTSPLHPDSYLARGSVATRPIQSAPRAANSAGIAKFVSNELPRRYLPEQFKSWLRTGFNAGDGVGAHDNIPIYTVDSSNPYQEFATFNSKDARVVNFPHLVKMNSGKVPLPSWAKTSDGGDKALAIYDVATGIYRSYFHAVKDGNGVWQYSSAGYIYTDPKTRNVGEHNYWLTHVAGGSSVVGMSNELTQIGAEEVKRGKINHMVSVTFPDYANTPSFPAKISDGRLSLTADKNAPRPGQVFTFPKSFDVDAYAKANNVDPTTVAIMKAVKNYGGIIADRNAFVMAFNFENPYGMGKGVNKYKSDPVLANKMSKLAINKFPWGKTEWVVPDYAKTHVQSNSAPVVKNVTSNRGNPGGANQVTIPTLKATDTEDGTLSTGKTLRITSIPKNGRLYYNKAKVTEGKVIKNYNPKSLKLDPNDGKITVKFKYSFSDSRGAWATPATVTQNFTSTAITGYVFNDVNNNGVKNTSDKGIPKVRINFVNVANGDRYSATTSTSGKFTRHLYPGTWRVVRSSVSGYKGGVVKPYRTSNSTLVKVSAGKTYHSNFGMYKSGKFVATVYQDKNRNGYKNTKEPGLNRVKVNLKGSVRHPSGALRTVSKTGYTNKYGVVKFTGLVPGVYTVTEYTPKKYKTTKNRVGNSGGKVSGDKIISVNISSGKTSNNYRFGEVRK